VGVVAGLLLSAAPVLAADESVRIYFFEFGPKEVTVEVGDTVTWTNQDRDAHTVTADDGSFDTGFILGGGQTAELTFEKAGTYPYHCKPHAGMKGTVTVVEAAAAEPSGEETTQPPTDALPATSAPSSPSGLAAASLILAAFLGLGLSGAILRRRARQAS